MKKFSGAELVLMISRYEDEVLSSDDPDISLLPDLFFDIAEHPASATTQVIAEAAFVHGPMFEAMLDLLDEADDSDYEAVASVFNQRAQFYMRVYANNVRVETFQHALDWVRRQFPRQSRAFDAWCARRAAAADTRPGRTSDASC